MHHPATCSQLSHAHSALAAACLKHRDCWGCCKPRAAKNTASFTLAVFSLVWHKHLLTGGKSVVLAYRTALCPVSSNRTGSVLTHCGHIDVTVCLCVPCCAMPGVLEPYRTALCVDTTLVCTQCRTSVPCVSRRCWVLPWLQVLASTGSTAACTTPHVTP